TDSEHNPILPSDFPGNCEYDNGHDRQKHDKKNLNEIRHCQAEPVKSVEQGYDHKSDSCLQETAVHAYKQESENPENPGRQGQVLISNHHVTASVAYSHYNDYDHDDGE